MLKKFLSFILVATLSLGISITGLGAVNTNPDEYNTVAVSKIVQQTEINGLKAKAYILIDGESGKVILENNSHEKLPLASVTKVMTMLLVMEAIDSNKITLQDMVQVSDHSYEMGGSQVFLKPGEEFTVDEMLKAVAVHSANDATVALAEKISGSEDVFVYAMNDKAKELGMNDTNFKDCTGLTDEGHYSSAYDISLMARELIEKHPKVIDYTTIWHDTFRNGQFALDNTNKMIKFYQGANGLKTGFTTKAGYCLAASAMRKNLQLISVVLGEADTNTRFAESRKLLDYGFANYEVIKVNQKGDLAGEVDVLKGVQTKAGTSLCDDVYLTLNKSEKNNVTTDIKYSSQLTAPITKGQKVGDVIFSINGAEVGKADIVSDVDIEAASYARILMRMFIHWIGFGK